MDLSIAAFLAQDGVTNGAIYALLALALVLVFTVTRIIWIPSGEFVTYGTLTLAGLQLGKPPGTVGLLVGVAVVAAVVETIATVRDGEWRRLPRRLALWLGVPLLIAAAVWWAAPRALPLPLQVLLTLAAVTALGPLLYRIVYQPIADASVLVLLIVSVALHFALTGLGLWFFGAEGSRTPPFTGASFQLGADDVQRAEPARRRDERRADRRALRVLRTHALRQGAARDGGQPRRRAARRHLAELRRRADVRAGRVAVRVLRRADRADHDRSITIPAFS